MGSQRLNIIIFIKNCCIEGWLVIEGYVSILQENNWASSAC